MSAQMSVVSRRRKVSFYVSSGVLVAVIVGLLGPLLIDIVVGWLPVAVWEAIYGSEEIHAGSGAHRIHVLTLAALFWGLTVALALQLRRPERRRAPMLQAVALGVTFLVIDLAAGSVSDEEGPLVAGVILVALLHPARSRLVPSSLRDRVMAGLAIAAAIPAVTFAIDQIKTQRLGIAGDEHAEFGHWASMAVFATVIVLWALIASSDLAGWRVTAWSAAGAAAVYGVASLVYPGLPSAAGTGFALAAIAWAAAVVWRAEWAAMRLRVASTEEVAERTVSPVVVRAQP